MLDRWVAGTVGVSGPLTRRSLKAWQLDRLAETVAYARARCPFYAARLPEGTVSSFAQFASLPFTTPQDLQAYGGQMLCVHPDAVDRVVTLHTSGSTGSPKRVYFTAADQELTVDYFHHGMAEFIRPGDRVLSLLPGESPGSLNDLLARALRRMGAQLLLFGFPVPERYEALLHTVLTQGAVCLVGPASAVAGAARLSQAQGRADALAGQIQSVLLAAAYVSPENRAEIGRIWQCRVNEHYGMTETGLAGAVGCCVPGGYHAWESGLYYEIIDPNTGTLRPDGERGELVVTTLRREGMPFIRYRTGDFSRFLPDPCPCGSILRRLERVAARPEGKKFFPPPVPSAL